MSRKLHIDHILPTLINLLSIAVTARASGHPTSSGLLNDNGDISGDTRMHSGNHAADDDGHIQCNQPEPTQPSTFHSSGTTSERNPARGTVAGIVLAVRKELVYLHFALLIISLVISLGLVLLIIYLWRRKWKPKNVDREEITQVDHRLFNNSVRPDIAVGVGAVVPRAVPLYTTPSSGYNSIASSRHSPHPSRVSNSGSGSITNPLSSECVPTPRCTNVPIFPPALPPCERQLKHSAFWLSHLPKSDDTISGAKGLLVQSASGTVVANFEPCQTIGSTSSGRASSVCEEISNRKDIEIADGQINLPHTL
jgi:hypothetical protein